MVDAISFRAAPANDLSKRDGSKVAETKGLYTTELAARIRADIKSAVRAGELPQAKYSVKTEVYSMGASITVRAHLPFPCLAEEGYRWDGYSLARVANVPHLTLAAARALASLEGIVAAYHWNRSDSASDYYNERFHADVELDYSGEYDARIAREKEFDRLARIVAETLCLDAE